MFRAGIFSVKPWKPHGVLNSCLEVKFRRSFVESCLKLASEWLQIGFKVAGIQKWLQNGFKIEPTTKERGLLLYFEAKGLVLVTF